MRFSEKAYLIAMLECAGFGKIDVKACASFFDLGHDISSAMAFALRKPDPVYKRAAESGLKKEVDSMLGRMLEKMRDAKGHIAVPASFWVVCATRLP